MKINEDNEVKKGTYFEIHFTLLIVDIFLKKIFWYIFVEFAVNKAILTVTSKMTNASYLLFAYFVQVYMLFI